MKTIIISIDPSGSYKSGKGTSGYAIMEKDTMKIIKLGNIKAKEYKTKDEYFIAHVKLLTKWNDYAVKRNIKTELIIESFILYRKAASSMYNQELETSELIGSLQLQATLNEIPTIKQPAHLIKGNLSRPHILLNIINKNEEQIVFKKTKADRTQWYWEGQRVSNHIVDALKHAIFYTIKEDKK